MNIYDERTVNFSMTGVKHVLNDSPYVIRYDIVR
jgi:hypothetical protein